MRSALLVLVGLVLGAAGYAAYRGDLAWQRRSGQTEAAEAAPPAQASPRGSASLPKLPVALTFHENRQGRGYVVQVHNISQKHLGVLVELKNPTLKQDVTVAVELAPGELREIGEAQGWTFVSGETVSVSQEGYEAASLTIP